jgi:hypothetical protein
MGKSLNALSNRLHRMRNVVHLRARVIDCAGAKEQLLAKLQRLRETLPGEECDQLTDEEQAQRLAALRAELQRRVEAARVWL